MVTTFQDSTSHVEYYLAGGWSWSNGNPYFAGISDYMGIAWWPQEGQLQANQGTYACAYCSYNGTWYQQPVPNPNYQLGHGDAMGFHQAYKTNVFVLPPGDREGHYLLAPTYNGCIYTVISSAQVPTSTNVGDLGETDFHTTSGISYSLSVTSGAPTLTIPTSSETPYYSQLVNWDY